MLFEVKLYSYDRYSFSRNLPQNTSRATLLIYDVLLETGENLGIVLRQYQEILHRVNEFLADSLEARLDLRYSRTASTVLLFEGPHECASSAVSDAVWRILYYVSALYSVRRYVVKQGLKGRMIVLLEEPDVHTFPYFVHLLSDLIREVSEDAYVVLTTHNGVFASLIADKVQDCVVYYVYRDSDGWTNAKKISLRKLAKHVVELSDLMLMRPREVLEKFVE